MNARNSRAAHSDKKRQKKYAKQKYYIAIIESERRIIINALNTLHNKLLTEGRYTDAVDDVLINIAYAPIRKFKIRMTGIFTDPVIFQFMDALYSSPQFHSASRIGFKLLPK